MLLAPVDFKKSLVLKNGGSEVGERLAWFYLKKPPAAKKPPTAEKPPAAEKAPAAKK